MADKFSVDVRGLKEVQAIMMKLGRKAPGALGGALFREGERIIGAAKEEVPVDTGNLRASGHVQLPEIGLTSASVEAGFGGPAADYALIVHEDMEASHKTGGPKYLERPFNEAVKTMDSRIAKDLRKALPEVTGR